MDEINDIGNVIANTIDNKGEDKRNFFGILRAQRGATDLYNISGDSLNLLNEAYKSNKIGADEYKEGLRNIIEATGNDLGLNVSLVYLDTSTMPKDSEGSTGSSYIVDRKNRKVLIPIDVNKIEDIKELLGTLTEEVAHGKDALEGRQDKKVAEDKSNDEEGLETLGRPANEYVKKKFGEDNNSKIKLTTDGIDLSNADVGEKVGDVVTLEDRKLKKYYHKETNKLEIAVNSFKEIPKGISYIGNLALDSVVDALFAEDMEQSIKNLNNKDNISKYIKIFRKKGRKAMLNEMSKEFDKIYLSKIYLSDVSKKLFVIYGAPDEIRKLYTNKEKDKNNNDIDIFILDKHLPEHMEDLWSNPKTSDNLDKISNYWKNELGDKDSFSLSEQNREKNKTIAYPDFTTSYKFYAFGKTKLFQSTYGSVKRLENGKYDVNITVIFQYTDRFEDVKNVNELSSAKQGLNKEFKGGKTFSFRTEPKRVTIKKQVDSLDEITGLLKNRLKGIDDNSNLGRYNIKGNVSLIKNNKLDNSNEIDNFKKYYNQ